MYQYTDFDRQFVRQRAAQYRDQLERNLRGELKDDEFRPLRLQNGWYVQRYAPMLRVAVPYGELASRQLRVLAQIARQYDQPSAAVYQHASETQAELGTPHLPVAPHPKDPDAMPARHESAGWLTRTALCVEVRDPQRGNGPKAERAAEAKRGGRAGVLYVFLPPLKFL